MMEPVKLLLEYTSMLKRRSRRGPIVLDESARVCPAAFWLWARQLPRQGEGYTYNLQWESIKRVTEVLRVEGN